MGKTKLIQLVISICVYSSILMSDLAHASGDSCMFQVSSDEMPPNIVFLIDNGVMMQQITWHADFDNDVDYTPFEAVESDVVPNGAAGNGFFNENGYAIFLTGGVFYLVPVRDDLTLVTKTRLQETGGKGSATWTINDKTITLPGVPSSTIDADGVKDNAEVFRYSKNYMNWLFFSGNYTGNGSDLPDKSRLYYAKKALLNVGKLTSNKAKFAIYNFTSTSEGASRVQPIGEVVSTLGGVPADNVLDTNYVNNINNMGAYLYSPLAEGLASIGGYINSDSFGIIDSTNYCQKSYAIVVSAGISSEDKSDLNQEIPGRLDDYDEDGSDGVGIDGPGQGTLTVDEVTYTITTGFNGSTYLDDVAHYLYSYDISVDNDEIGGFQNLVTYTVGFMASQETQAFLINTSNNGNGYPNLNDSSHPGYGKFHFEAETAQGLSQAILDAVNVIISKPATFVAPVVPVTRTTSGDKIYMAFFIPTEENFWEGYVSKFSLNSQNEIIDANGDPATWPNGAMREEAVPFWTTKDWANTANTNRNIYTYLGTNLDLTAAENDFDTTNSDLTDLLLGFPADITVNGTVVIGRDKVINFVRGADVFDQDEDTDTSENRDFITGDVLHSEPVVFTYHYADNTTTTMVYFGANDGMLHAVLDETDPDIDTYGDENTHGTEAWSFIPPDQLIRLKYMIEGTIHKEFVDSSPKIYFHDANQDGFVDPDAGDKVILVCGERKGGTSYFGLDVTVPDDPKYMWRIGSGNEDTIIRYDGKTLAFGVNSWVGNLTTEMYNDYMSGDMTTYPFVWGLIVSSIATGPEEGILELTNIRRHAGGTFQNDENLTLWDGVARTWTNAAMVMGDELTPDVIVSELGESWSEPQFGLVKTTNDDTDGTAVFFIGGGYSENNSAGKIVVAIDVFTGEVVRKFTDINTYTTDTEHTTDTNIYYSVPSSVKVVDEDNNGFVDKVYVGDLGGQVWRFGQVSFDSDGNTLSFPDSDENINNWTGQILFRAPTDVVDAVSYTRKFFYPPSVTLEHGYDLIFIGTGDREAACDTTTGADRIYSIKDTHGSNTLIEADLVDVTDPLATTPNLDLTNSDVDLNGQYDQGWYIRLVDQSDAAVGEKVLANGTVFYKTLYITTFTPNNHPCLPGGEARLYAVNYKTGRAVLFLGGDIDGDGNADLTRSVMIGGGIPSKPVMVIKQESRKILISVGSTVPETTSEILDAGIIGIDPLEPAKNFFIRYWRQLFG